MTILYRAYDIIAAKRDGRKLTAEEIRWITGSFTKGETPDYQMAALLMAIYLKGLDNEETANLTMAMADSGEKVDLSDIPGIKVDKHSTGGVADTTTLVLGPLVAACGGRVAKMSGRGLGHTGGTIDKLESIPGFHTEIPLGKFIDIVKSVGIAVVAQSADLAPADKMLYALRDTTATIENMGLIASSIVSKKLAAGCDAILLDVKTGKGAFMKTLEDSKALASLMVDIGRMAGKRMIAAVTDMDQPLGNAIGNALEVKEAIDTLSGKGPKRLTELCISLGGQMLIMGGQAGDITAAKSMIKEALKSGAGLRKFAEMIEAQGGDPEAAVNPSILPRAKYIYPVKASISGYVGSIESLELGRISVILGAGRARKEDPVDPAVGIVLETGLNDKVAEGDVIAWVHANSSDLGQECIGRVAKALVITPEPTNVPPLIYDYIS